MTPINNTVVAPMHGVGWVGGDTYFVLHSIGCELHSCPYVCTPMDKELFSYDYLLFQFMLIFVSNLV